MNRRLVLNLVFETNDIAENSDGSCNTRGAEQSKWAEPGRCNARCVIADEDEPSPIKRMPITVIFHQS